MSTVVNKHSIDPDNQDFYTRMADTWWDKDGPFWPIHHLNMVRVEYLKRWMVSHFGLTADSSRPLQGLRILDIGCGGGVLSESMYRLGATVTAIDVVERNIHIARTHARQQRINIDYRHVSAEDLQRQGETYDVILNMEVVEHVINLPDFIHTCTGLLRPQGLMFVATINRTITSWFTAILGAEYILRWLSKHTHQWHKFRKPEEIRVLLERDGLQLADCTGVLVNPVTRTMRLSALTWVNYMLVATTPQHSDNSGQL